MHRNLDTYPSFTNFRNPADFNGRTVGQITKFLWLLALTQRHRIVPSGEDAFGLNYTLLGREFNRLDLIKFFIRGFVVVVQGDREKNFGIVGAKLINVRISCRDRGGKFSRFPSILYARKHVKGTCDTSCSVCFPNTRWG